MVKAAEVIPPVGLHRTEDHRYYWMGEGPLPSITTAIGMYDKSDALVGWAKRETASFAVRNLDALVEHRTHNSPEPSCGPCMKAYRPFDRTAAAQRWISAIPDYMKDAAADLGTRVHLVAESLAKGEHYAAEQDPVTLPYAGQYLRFMDEYTPDFLAVEYMGVNESWGYAGTGDIIATVDHPDLPGPTAIDIKTFTKPGPITFTKGRPRYYPTTGMQLAACAALEFIGKADDPVKYPVPDVQSYAVLLVGQEDYHLIPYRVTGATFEAFLSCLHLLGWAKGEAKTIVDAA